MKKRLALAIAMSVIWMSGTCASAYDESIHFAMVQLLAQKHGFSPAEALFIAQASQSMDENDSTTAYSREKVAVEASHLPSDLANLDHMRTGQLFHALTEHREEVSQVHVDRINQELKATADPQHSERALLYFGEYLHFLSDSAVHPTNSLLGHALKGEIPDRPENSPQKLELAMRAMDEAMDDFNKARDPKTANPIMAAPTWSTESGVELPVPRRTVLSDVETALHDKVIRSLKPTSALEYAVANTSEKLQGGREGQLEYELRDFALKNGMTFNGDHRYLILDSNGDPTDSAENVARFGKTGEIDRLSKFQMAASIPDLVEERNNEVFLASCLAFGLTGGHSEIAWKLPSSLGGIALDPELTLPAEIGEVKQVTIDKYGEVVVESSNGTYPIDGLDTQRFATVVRAVAGGEIPYITIGAEPSEQPGYARVTYAPLLWGTSVGNDLYRADIQFKAIFAHYPFGAGYHLNAQNDLLASGFPGFGGEFMRLWITSSDIRMKVAGGRLTTTSHGMKIFAETKLLGQPVQDHAMEQYAQKLTDNWDAISDQLPEFRSVQRLALAAGIAFWVREHRVQVNPIIWTIPNQEDSTPLYSPALAIVKDGDCVITGGVTLTPDDKGSLPGRTFFQQFASILDAREQASGSGLFLRIVLATIVILSLILLILVTAGILWLLEEWANRASPQGPGYWKTVRVWVRILLAQGFLSICAWPLISDANTSLSIFDKAFVAFAVTMIASPLIFFVAIRRLEPGNRGSGVTLGKLLCALSVPGVTGTCSSLIALLTLIFFGSVPTKAMDGVLTAELTPANTLLMHQSYLNGKWIPQFKRETHLSGASKPGPVYFDGDSSVPGALMQPVAWPGDMQMSQDPAIQYYSPDGLPPYGREKSP